jgi:hypothetical protein
MGGIASRLGAERRGPGHEGLGAWPQLLAVVALASVLSGCLGDSTLEPLPPGPPVDCRAIPVVTCQQIVNDARTNADPGTAPVQIRAVCTTTCIPQSGDVKVDVLYSNGRRESYGMNWSGAAAPGGGQVPGPEATLPVPPTCQGVPVEHCRQQALAIVADGPASIGGGGQAITSILVRCTVDPCTRERGGGETTVTYADGSTSGSSWSYEGVAPGG